MHLRLFLERSQLVQQLAHLLLLALHHFFEQLLVHPVFLFPEPGPIIPLLGYEFEGLLLDIVVVQRGLLELNVVFPVLLDVKLHLRIVVHHLEHVLRVQ